jgi:signal peptidase I
MPDIAPASSPGLGHPGAAPSSIRRDVAVLLTLLAPGAGHFLVGTFRRGLAWAIGLPIAMCVVLLAMPVSLSAFLVAILIALLAYVGMAVDLVRLPVGRPPWKTLIPAWAALLVVEYVAGATLAGYYRTHYAQAFTIPSGAMTPALLHGDYVLVDKSAYRARPPRRGDIVVFRHPRDDRRIYVKRIVGIPGEEIQIQGRQILVNGTALAEPYLAATAPDAGAGGPCEVAYGCRPTSVPPDGYFVLGDYRDLSQDSRHWGFVRRDRILGRATAIYWSWDSARHWLRPERIGRRL